MQVSVSERLMVQKTAITLVTRHLPRPALWTVKLQGGRKNGLQVILIMVYSSCSQNLEREKCLLLPEAKLEQ